MQHLHLLAFFALILPTIAPAQSALGLFEDHSDIGTVLHPGTAAYNSADRTYTLTASGENMWSTADAFQFLWKKVSNRDIALSADISFPTRTGNPHKKAVLIIRQSLEAGSPYVDAALHGAGLTSLQSRAETNGATHEVGIDDEAATSLRLEKRGDDFYLFVARPGEKLHLEGGAMHLALQAPFYIGLGLCAHDKDAVESAVFSNVSIAEPARGKLKLFSTLETVSVSSTDRRVVAVYAGAISSPSYSPDGSHLIFKQGKNWLQIAPSGGAPAQAATAPTSAKIAPSAAHPSPDTLREVSASYSAQKPAPTTLTVKTLKDGTTKTIANITGAQGTLGDSPWSPDSKRIVFVSYQWLPRK